uniref:Uncharacterized protein n=1 Tax=Opuntia streptacantha TaxID=393608 RepID=A0A7C8YKM8_OPUST
MKPSKHVVVEERCTCKPEVKVTSRLVEEVICSSTEGEVLVKGEGWVRENDGSMVVVVSCNGRLEMEEVGTFGDMSVKGVMMVEEGICNGRLVLEVETREEVEICNSKLDLEVVVVNGGGMARLEVEEICSGTMVQGIQLVEEGTCDGRSLLEVVGICNSTVVAEKMRVEVEVETCGGILVLKNTAMVGEDSCGDKVEVEVVENCNSTLE